MATLTLSETKIETVTAESAPKSPNVVLKLRKTKTDKAVQWKEGTIDNEHMNKKKSKCCCIYEKPRMFGESSSEDEDDDCENCHGHRKKNNPKHQNPDSQDASQS